MLAVRSLRIGEPPDHSWSRLPFYIWLCAACKMGVVPVALLLVAARKRLLRARKRGLDNNNNNRELPQNGPHTDGPHCTSG